MKRRVMAGFGGSSAAGGRGGAFRIGAGGREVRVSWAQGAAPWPGPGLVGRGLDGRGASESTASGTGEAGRGPWAGARRR